MDFKNREKLESALVQELSTHREELRELLDELNERTYEEHFYRFYHGSFKVYYTQASTERIVASLKMLLPERPLNESFCQIIAAGTGKTWKESDNQDWAAVTRPMLEAFTHAKFMLEMAVKYSDIKEAPSLLPSGYAALLYLYDLR